MGQGRARIRALTRRAAPVAGTLVMALAAGSALAAGATTGRSPGAPTHRPRLVVDVRGRLGLAVALPPLAAGDVQQRTVTLRARGNAPVAAAALTVIAPGATSAISRNGFALRVDRCSRPWVAASGTALRCPGRVRTIVRWLPVGGRMSTRRIGSVPARGAAWLRVSLRLPANAAADQEGRSLRLRYRFTAA
jgi:hypothetical protein